MSLESPRLPAAVLAIGLTASALSGCSGTASPEASHASDPITATSPAVPTQDAPDRFSSSKLPDGTVQGYVTRYEGFSTQEVDAMEHCGNTSSDVLLTFDDEGSPEHVRKIMDVLEAHNSAAIFFPKSSSVDSQLATEMRERGFWVGNHTATHPDISSLPSKGIAQEIKNGFESSLFRPPYGAMKEAENPNPEKADTLFDYRAQTTAARLGIRTCLWTIDTNDWDAKVATADYIVSRVRERMQSGAVVLGHMFDHTHTLEALPGIFAEIEAAGLEPCALPQHPTKSKIPAELPC